MPLILTWGMGVGGGSGDGVPLTNIAQSLSSLTKSGLSAADIALLWDPNTGSADFGLLKNDLLTDASLETAMFLSIFLDRRAEDSDILPDADTDRRGWWGDSFAAISGDKIGSRLWLLRRSKRTPDVLTRAEQYGREALAWLVEDKVASKVDVAPSFIGRDGWALDMAVFRPKVDPAHFRYTQTWVAQEMMRT